MGSSTTQVDGLQKGVAAATMGFGAAALLAPNLLARTYGVSEPAPEYTYVARLWGSGLLALGSLTFSADSADSKRTLATVGLAVNAADTLAALTAGGMPWSTRLLAAATSAGFGAANMTVLRAD